MRPSVSVAATLAALVLAQPALASNLANSANSEHCAADVLESVRVPTDQGPARDRAQRKLLEKIDAAYADLLAAEAGTSHLRRSDESQCRVDAYRTRAASLEPVRQSARQSLEEARKAVEKDEQIASSLCLPYDVGSRAWKRCEKAATVHRAKLRRRLREAERIWQRLARAPDYASDQGDRYWTSPSALREAIADVEASGKSVEPRHLGPEVWCGETNLRKAEILLRPESEFMRVTGEFEPAHRNLRNYEARYAQARELELEMLERQGEPVRRRVADAILAKLRKLREGRETWRCQANWNGTRTQELAAVPAAAATAYRNAKRAFEALESRCDVHRPQEGARTLAQAHSPEWIDCLKAVEQARAEEAHVLERKRAIHEAIRSAARRVAKGPEPPRAAPGIDRNSARDSIAANHGDTQRQASSALDR